MTGKRRIYDDLNDDPQFKDFKRRVKADLIPKIDSSFATVSLVPAGETDIKFAIELGLSIMLDKKIIAVVQPGTKIPEHLARVADEIIEADFRTSEGMAYTSQKITEAMARLGESEDQTQEDE
jgi:hypothetical protein